MLSQMKWVRTELMALIVVALLLGSAWAAKPVKPPPEPEPEPDPPPVTYKLTWLDTFGLSYVWAINSRGHVVGHAEATPGYSGDNFAFLYTPEGGMIDLNSLLPEGSGWLLRRAWGINDQGQIVGYGELEGDPTFRAYRYTPAVLDENGAVLQSAQVEQIGPLTPDDYKWSATSINNWGEVCGLVSDTTTNINTAWYYNDITGIEPLLGEMNLFPWKINDSGQILANDKDTMLVVRVVPGETPEFFCSPCGEEFWLRANDMNDDGWFVGDAVLQVTQTRKKTTIHSGAYRHDGVLCLDLGTGYGSVAEGINNHGDVVGNFSKVADEGRGFVYYNELDQVVVLDDAVTADPTDLALWHDANTLLYILKINDAGQIAGHAYFSLSGTYQAFLLTPVLNDN